MVCELITVVYPGFWKC